jgi:magnesium chelatase accessory protein
MMAQWDVEMLAERLTFIETPCLFLVGEDDGTVPPRVAREAAARMPRAEVRGWEHRGHLLHEEEAEQVAQAITAFLAALPVPPKNDVPAGTRGKSMT